MEEVVIDFLCAAAIAFFLGEHERLAMVVFGAALVTALEFALGLASTLALDVTLEFAFGAVTGLVLGVILVAAGRTPVLGTGRAGRLPTNFFARLATVVVLGTAAAF